jgi:hypothetical protein
MELVAPRGYVGLGEKHSLKALGQWSILLPGTLKGWKLILSSLEKWSGKSKKNKNLIVIIIIYSSFGELIVILEDRRGPKLRGVRPKFCLIVAGPWHCPSPPPPPLVGLLIVPKNYAMTYNSFLVNFVKNIIILQISLCIIHKKKINLIHFNRGYYITCHYDILKWIKRIE